MPFAQRLNLSSAKPGAQLGRILTALLAGAWLATSAAAQEYRVDASDPEAKKLGAVALQCIRIPARFAEDRAKFELYFTKFYFPEMTRTGSDELGRLGDMRYNLFKKFLWASDNEQLQQRLSELALSAMARIVAAPDPPYHPAVRYNAILIIGMLDDQYAREGANARPAKPMAKATKALTAVVASATTTSRFSPPVILGAVIGLERHAQLRDSLAPDAAQAMTAALVKLINHDKPIQEMNRNVYDWLRLRAASALAELRSVGPNNAVHDGLFKLLANFKSLDDRTAAAGLLKKLNYKDVKLDGAAATEPLFQLARDLGEAEAKRAQEFQDAQIGLGGGGGFGGGRGGERGYVPAGGDEELFPRRHVLARLTDLRAGLEAVKPVVPAETQTKIDALIAAINPVMVAARDKDTVELRFTAAVSDMATAINRAVPPPEPPADEAEEESF